MPKTVFYNPASGDSHYLDLLSGEGLRCLERRPMTSSDLVEELSGVLEVPADDALSRYVERMLSSFSKLGLTKPALT